MRESPPAGRTVQPAWADQTSRRRVMVGIFRDLEHADVYLETFLVTSWAEHVRQHERSARGDREIEALIRHHVEDEPVVQHLVHAELEF
jgi:hypothetical protein